MMSKTTNRFSPEVCERAMRLVLNTGGQRGSRWQAILPVAAKIGCSGHALNEGVRKAEGDGGKRAGVSSEVAERASISRDARWHG
jgi:transposase-like protein